MESIYLAGFDVFLPDAKRRGEELKRLCRDFGFVGIFPMDNECPSLLHGQELARWIFNANISLIKSASCVMANINNFRGAEPDSGTCFEIGYAAALGLPVWAYTSDGRTLIQQVPCSAKADGSYQDNQGFTVENFELPRNLMLCCSANIVIGNERDCLAAMAAQHKGT